MTVTVSGIQQQYEIEQFYYQEAELLDGREWRSWLALLTEDVHYRVPSRGNGVLPHEGDLAHFDDDLSMLVTRVRRLESSSAWSERPPSRTRRIVSNVRVAGDLSVRSNFLLYQNRLEHEVHVWAGERHDVLRRSDDGLRIAARTVLLDQAVMLAGGVSVFF